MSPVHSIDLNSPFDLYLKRGIDNPTANTHDIKATPSWDNGKSIGIYKNSSEYFCTNCEYKLLVEAPANSLMMISAWSKSEIIEIKLNDF